MLRLVVPFVREVTASSSTEVAADVEASAGWEEDESSCSGSGSDSDGSSASSWALEEGCEDCVVGSVVALELVLFFLFFLFFSILILWRLEERHERRASYVPGTAGLSMFLG